VDNLGVLMLKGNVCFQLKRFDEAIKDFNKVLELDKDNVDAILWRGKIYYNSNMPEKAIVEFDRVLEINPDDQNAKKFKEMILKPE
jgi:tetratricopeptide (TPR) repeat protein